MVISQNDVYKQADTIEALYSELQSQIFNKIIDRLMNVKGVDDTNVLAWQMKQLNESGMLTNDVIKLVSQITGQSSEQLNNMIVDTGMTVNDDITKELGTLTGLKRSVRSDNRQMLQGLLKQTKNDLNNNVNESLITKNQQRNPAIKTYTDIVRKSTVEVVTGLKTHDRAIADNVYKWINSGMKTGLIDGGGRMWSIDSYSRMVINTAAHNAFNETRMAAMDKFDVTLATMSAHAASRPECAGIQGMIVNMIPESDPRFNSKYDTVYNHEYKEPAGTQGINCHHILKPFVEGVSTNTYEHPDEQQAIENGATQAKQRAYERQIRKDKQLLSAAQRLKDDVGISKYKSLLSAHQKRVRELVKQNNFLHRDYSREKLLVE